MKKSLVWLRRDLRLNDNAALAYATNHYDEVHLVFVFDEIILNKLKDKADQRVSFIFDSLMQIKQALEKTNASINILFGDPSLIIPEIAKNLKVDAVLTNRDYEVYAKSRDQKVSKNLQTLNIEFKDFKDTVLFEADEVLTQTNGYYRVFTPYKNAWIAQLEKKPQVMLECEVNKRKITISKLSGIKQVETLEDIGFIATDSKILNASKTYNNFVKKMENYQSDRDFPAIEGTSRLSVHLRFGTISSRQLVRAIFHKKDQGTRTWLSELIWREFYFALLDKNPSVEKHAYQQKYENIPWENDKKLFNQWCEGKTGVPIVDAAMRQLNQTGWMHNRLRMITASYLVKTLLIDWRWGEKYFAQKLIDFDLSANNGGWQWASSTGCDAAPYFRVFNPYRQSERFDNNGEFIKTYCPELKLIPKKYIHDPSSMPLDIQANADCVIGRDYPYPIANYKLNRIKVINMFKNVGE